MELTTKKTLSVWPRKDNEGSLTAEDVATCQKCCSHVHDKGGNTHSKMHHSTLHGFAI